MKENEKVSTLLLNRGTLLCKIGKIGAKCFCVGIGLFVLYFIIAIIAFNALSVGFYFFTSDVAIANFTMYLSTILTGLGTVGVSFYFLGLHFLGLGQIAQNTDKE